METFLEILREVLKGMLRELAAFILLENRSRKQENHPPSQAKGWFTKNIKQTTTTLKVIVAWRSVGALLFFIFIPIILK